MSIFSNLKDKVANYVDVRLSLLKLGVVERASNALSTVVFSVLVFFALLLFLIFLGISMMMAISDWVNSPALGALITAGFFLLLVIMFILLRKPIGKAFANMFVGILTAQPEEEDDEDEISLPKAKNIDVD